MTLSFYVAVKKSAATSLRRLLFWISVCLLLVLLQMLTSLLLSGGVFILSGDALVSPFRCCLRRPRGDLTCERRCRSPASGTECETNMDVVTAAVTLSLYAPVALVAFALLAVLLAAYAKDTAALRLSAVCQAASSSLILTGLSAFLLLNWSRVSWEHMTIGFHTCVGVQVQLVVLAALTHMSGRRLASEWDDGKPC